MKYSKLPRIYIKAKIEPEKNIEILGENYNYIKNVMRIKTGFLIRIYNAVDGEYIGVLNFDKKLAYIEVREKFRNVHAEENEISLFMAVIKQDKFELVCDMATQLGVTKIVPILTERSQRRELNYERLNKIIFEASRQSERFFAPVISEIIELKEIAAASCDIIYFANENEVNIEQKFQKSKKIGLLIGPEGGFSEEEMDLLRADKLIYSVSLGINVLRSETAAIAMLARFL